MNDAVPLPGSPVRGALSVRLKRSLSVLKPLLPFGAFVAGAAAFAQTTEPTPPTPLPSLELERLTLNPAGTGSLVLDTGEVMRKGTFRLSLTGHYEHDPLVSLVDGKVDGSVVQHRVTGSLAGAYGISDRLEISAQVPLLLMQQAGSQSGFERPAEGMALGTPYVGMRLGLLRQEQQHGVDLALGLNAGLPLGSAASLARDSKLRAIPSIMVGREFGRLRAAVNAGLLLRPTTLIPSTNKAEVGDALRLGAVVSTTGKRLRGELDVLAHVPLRNEPKTVEAMAGARLPLPSSFEVYALAGMGFGRAAGTPDFRGVMGVAYTFGGKPTPPPEPVPGCPEDPEKCPLPSGPDCTKPGECPELPLPVVYFDFSEAQWNKSPDEILAECTKHTVKTGENCINLIRRIDETKTQLNTLARFLNDHREFKTIWVEGHTDEINADSMGGNQKLSLDRANAVKSYLVKPGGVAEERLHVEGYAEKHPMDPNNPKDMAKNRRVEFCTMPRDEKGERKELCAKLPADQGLVTNNTGNGKQQAHPNDVPTKPREGKKVRQQPVTNGPAAQGPVVSTDKGNQKKRQGEFHPSPRAKVGRQ
ncbi:OmpA family protein [Cystobacter fuscus]|uniref:OmpA family protein n=1 Tax=Cystobacter fuscus TaxID=43 RepID=UPI002B2E9694|nr:OmpA family protein [Cystobacter fuscus]